MQKFKVREKKKKKSREKEKKKAEKKKRKKQRKRKEKKTYTPEVIRIPCFAATITFKSSAEWGLSYTSCVNWPK